MKRAINLPSLILRWKALSVRHFLESKHKHGKGVGGNQNKALSQPQGSPECKILIKPSPRLGNTIYLTRKRTQKINPAPLIMFPIN